MTKVICDICGSDKSHNQFSVLCHLASFANDALNSYTDNEGNRVSGRPDSFDLCNKCYNEVMGVAMKKFYELRKKYEYTK